MRIRHLTAHLVRLSLKRAFTHASTSRDVSENLLVRCELANGAVGWGEGVPRPYVTGETPAGCLEQLASTPLGDQLSADCNTWSDVIAMCEQFVPAACREDPRECYGNALRCAVELSVLDAYGQLFGEPVSAVASSASFAAAICKASRAVQYSAIIDAGSKGLRRKSIVRRLYGFSDCKVKVGADKDDDVARLHTIRSWIGPRMDLRLDANEAWHADELIAKIAALEPFGISCIEQPVAHADVQSLAPLRAAIGIAVMLDESLTSVKDAANAIADGTCDFFNIRLSKCGGFLNSLRLAVMAHDAGLRYQLGCHPGETGVLSAAGRQWACSVANIRYCEGSYDRHILRSRITHEDMTFGYGGWANAISRAGLGVRIDEAALEKAIVMQKRFEIA